MMNDRGAIMFDQSEEPREALGGHGGPDDKGRPDRPAGVAT
jgi:hypothetical protein